MLEDLKDMAQHDNLPEAAIEKLEKIEEVTQQRLVVLQIALRAGWATGSPPYNYPNKILYLKWYTIPLQQEITSGWRLWEMASPELKMPSCNTVVEDVVDVEAGVAVATGEITILMATFISDSRENKDTKK